MSYNGSGVFNINTAGQPVVTGTVISSSVFNTLTADLATGLSTCITKDGQTTVSANIPMNSFKFTGLAAGTAATDSVRLGQLQAGGATLVTVTGTDTYTGTMSPALAGYAAGNTFSFVVPNTNTTSCTLNIDGQGAKAITRDGSTALVAGDLVAGSEVVVVYDGTRFQVLNSNSKTNWNLSGTLTVAGNTTLSAGTANGVAYLNGSKVLTTGSGLTFDGTNLGVGTASPFAKIAVEQTGGDLLTYRFNSSNARAGLYVGGSSGSPFIGSNLTFSSGNIFNYDKTGLMWYAGDPSGAGNFYIAVGTGTTGTSAGTNTGTNIRLQVTTTGNVTINAPTSGQALAMTGTAAGTAALTINTSATTGAQTATFSATNKPGAAAQTTPTKWLPIILDGTTYYIPAFS